MPTQDGIIKISGTIDNLTFYQSNGKFYVRKNKPLDGDRVKTELCFENTRRYARWFSQTSRLASIIYKKIVPAERDYKTVWIPLRHRTHQLVRQYLADDEIIRILQMEFLAGKKLVKSLPIQKPVEAAQISIDPVQTLFLRSDYETNATKLIDQVVASRLFIKNLLETKLSFKESYGLKNEASRKHEVIDS
jgi:hypothetical protein